MTANKSEVFRAALDRKDETKLIHQPTDDMTTTHGEKDAQPEQWKN